MKVNINDALSTIKSRASTAVGSLSLPVGPNQSFQSAATQVARSPDYTVSLVCTELDIYINADMPDTFMFDIGSEYSAPWAEGLNDSMAAPVSAFVKSAGISMTTQALTAQLWRGSSEINFTLPLIFQAEKDEDVEVLKPLMELMYLTLPREAESGGMLSAPGPSFDLVNLNASTPSKESLNSKNEKSVAGQSNSSKSGLGAALAKMEEGLSTVVSGAQSVGGAVVGALNGDLQQIKNSTSTMVSGLNKTIAPLSNQLKGMVKNQISLKIGRFIEFPSVVITNVQQSHKVNPTVDALGRATSLQLNET